VALHSLLEALKTVNLPNVLLEEVHLLDLRQNAMVSKLVGTVKAKKLYLLYPDQSQLKNVKQHAKLLVKMDAASTSQASRIPVGSEREVTHTLKEVLAKIDNHLSVLLEVHLLQGTQTQNATISRLESHAKVSVEASG
jgi:hypothetical protein